MFFIPSGFPEMAYLSNVLIHLQLEAMMTIGTQHPNTLLDIQDEYYSKYGHYEVQIKSFGTENNFRVMDKIIVLEGLGLVENFLRIFGPGIRRLAYGVGEELDDQLWKN